MRFFIILSYKYLNTVL